MRLLMLSLAFALCLGVPHGAKAETNVPLAIVDIALVRPIGVVVATASTAVYTGLVVPLFLMGIADEAAYLMIEEPWEFTAGRDPGDF